LRGHARELFLMYPPRRDLKIEQVSGLGTNLQIGRKGAWPILHTPLLGNIQQQSAQSWRGILLCRDRAAQKASNN
jgi:hypothetical protein